MGHAFQLNEQDGEIAVVTFDRPGLKVNTLSLAVLHELGEVIDQIEGRSDWKGLLFRSGKPGVFIAGADLNELGELASAGPDQVRAMITLGQDLFSRIGRLPFPIVALIEGPCLGGGLELALAFDERIAARTPQTAMGCPEVKLGIIPGWGGTQRLPRLIGLHAIELVCGGEPVTAERAAALGLVFEAVAPERLLDEGRRLLELLRQDDAWQVRRRRLQQPLDLSTDQFQFAFSVAEGKIRERTAGHYPAPLAALKAIRDGGARTLDEGLRIEQEAILKLVPTPTATNLIGLFFMKNRLARDPGTSTPGVVPRPMRRVGVLGAGQMGAGIATAHARSGIPTALVDVDDARLDAGLKRAQDVALSRIKIGRATPQDLARMLAHLSTATTHGIFSDCDVVIEAVPEDEALKTEMYRNLAWFLRDDAILASNTSTIPVSRMAQSVPHPERFVGMHFFYPVDRMELVEVIRGELTSDETIATIVALAKQLRKTPIVVRDCPGFLVNRVLFPYMSEALRLLEDGASMDAIDAAATRFGMPMGPIALFDLVGLDTAEAIIKVMVDAYPDRASPSPLLEELVRAGRLGQKSGAGFRKHGGKRPQADPAFGPLLERHRLDRRMPDESEIVDRLFLPMLVEGTRVIEEGIVRDPADLDMGVILGVGFPAFRGGLLRWGDAEGADKVLSRLSRYEALGPRFEPTETLRRMAVSGESFFPRPRLTEGARLVPVA